MRKTREVLRLYFDLKLGQRQIARSANLSQSTAHDYLERFRATGLSWPLPAGMSEAELERKLFPADSSVPKPGAKTLPDFPAIHEELRSHKHTTLQLLWEEYRAVHADGYGYSRFCHHYQRWKQERDLVLRQQHRPGEKLFVDWAGATIPIYDPSTGEAHPAQLFVAVLGASNYTYAEADRTSRWPVGSVRTVAPSSFLLAVLSW
jgi:transposase